MEQTEALPPDRQPALPNTRGRRSPGPGSLGRGGRGVGETFMPTRPASSPAGVLDRKRNREHGHMGPRRAIHLM